MTSEMARKMASETYEYYSYFARAAVVTALGLALSQKQMKRKENRKTANYIQVVNMMQNMPPAYFVHYIRTFCLQYEYV